MGHEKQNEIIIFQSTDGQARIEVQTDYDTVWLTKDQIAALFQRDRSVISRHINNIFREEELERDDTTSFVQNLHKTSGGRPLEYFSLDVIISVGYRVKSKRGVEFRQWATKVLRQYLVDGYALNPVRLKHAPGSLLDLFKMQVQLWERQELLNTEIQEDIKQLGEKILNIEAKITSVDDHYYTIAGYCNLHKVPCPLHKAKEWGKLATKLSRESSIATGTAHDERFGKVRTYHVDILKQAIQG